MKKVIIVIASLAVIGAGFAFSNAGVITHKTEGESTSAGTAITVSETQTETTTAAKKNKKEKPTESQNENESESTAQKETTTETTAQTTEKATEKAKEKKKKSESAKKKTKKTNKKKEEANTTTTESSESTCTITIECKDIFNHLDKASESCKEKLPKSGYILNSYTYTFEEGETVYDVLMQVKETKGISVYVKDTAYGKYVAGINGINEKEVGPTSGWTYYVNGSFPMKSMSKYKVQKGDSILIHYSCVYN